MWRFFYEKKIYTCLFKSDNFYFYSDSDELSYPSLSLSVSEFESLTGQSWISGLNNIFLL